MIEGRQADDVHAGRPPVMGDSIDVDIIDAGQDHACGAEDHAPDKDEIGRMRTDGGDRGFEGCPAQFEGARQAAHESNHARGDPGDQERGLPVNRDSMTSVANELRSQNSPSYFAERLLAEAKASGQDCIVESIRTEGEVRKLRELGALLFAVDADQRLRYERITARKSATDSVSFDKFAADEAREMDSAGDPNKQNLRACIEAADVRIRNEGTLDELHAQVRAALA